MSIYDYTQKTHPAGFKGYRVSVMVEGDHRQKYFSTNGDDANTMLSKYIKARELEKKWIKEKEAGIKRFNNEANTTARSKFGTGVRGISLRIFPEGARYKVQGMHLKEEFNKSFHATDKGWKEAVKFLAKKKHLTRWKHLLERITWKTH